MFYVQQTAESVHSIRDTSVHSIRACQAYLGVLEYDAEYNVLRGGRMNVC